MADSWLKIAVVVVCAWVGKEFPDKRQNERRMKFIREGEVIRTMGPLKEELTPLVGELPIFIASRWEKTPIGMEALGDWLG